VSRLANPALCCFISAIPTEQPLKIDFTEFAPQVRHDCRLGVFYRPRRGAGISRSNAPATLSGHEVKVLALNGSHEDLEGPSTEGTVILEFPSIEAAKAWYNSSPYREVREHRLKGATYGVTLVEGVSSQPAQARHWVEFVGAV
jgi:uncharacterized protein (DUF1330 family)